MRKYLFLAGSCMCFLIACTEPNNSQVIELNGNVEPVQTETVDVAVVTENAANHVEETPQWCENGLSVEPISVSGTNWDKGFGKARASILLGEVVMTDQNSYKYIDIKSPDKPSGDRRSINSQKALSNGRQVINFTGERLSPEQVELPLCFSR